MKKLLSLLVAIAGAFFVPVSPASAGALYVYVDKSVQRMWVILDGKEVGVWPVSTADEHTRTCGISGNETCRTPEGLFRPTSFARNGYSRKFKAPMPNAVFFDHDGDAIHAATWNELGSLGRPASHGCVRLHPDHAQMFFQLAQQNATRIEIVDGE